MLKFTYSNLSRIFKFYKSINFGIKTKPSILAIELNNDCNAECIMCGHENIERPKMQMDFNLFKAIVIDAKKNNIKIIQLSFYGEPTLYSKLIEAVSFVKEQIPDSTILINTNAALLNKKLSKNIIEAGIALFSISVDGNNKQEFEQIRHGLKWDIVRQNIKDLKELIIENSYSTQVNIRGLILKDYPFDFDAYYKNWGSYAHKVIMRNDHYMYSKQKEPLLHKLLPCNRLFSQVIITVNGDVTICPYDWHGKMIYAKFPDKNIKQLWRTNSLVRKRILHLFGMKKSMAFCKTCTYRAIRAHSKDGELSNCNN